MVFKQGHLQAWTLQTDEITKNRQIIAKTKNCKDVKQGEIIRKINIAAGKSKIKGQASFKLKQTKPEVFGK